MNVELTEDAILRDGKKVGALSFMPAWKRWRWTIGDAVGDERTRGQVLTVVRMFLRNEEARAR